jgi:hypothetical protein
MITSSVYTQWLPIRPQYSEQIPLDRQLNGVEALEFVGKLCDLTILRPTVSDLGLHTCEVHRLTARCQYVCIQRMQTSKAHLVQDRHRMI